VLCLTLGALAELEAAFAVEDLNALTERFAAGRLSAHDICKVVTAGLRGGGADVTEEDVQSMRADGGAAGLARIVGELLRATFGGTAEAGPADPMPPRQARRAGSPGTN
jgi:hypothetical protein